MFSQREEGIIYANIFKQLPSEGTHIIFKEEYEPYTYRSCQIKDFYLWFEHELFEQFITLVSDRSENSKRRGAIRQWQNIQGKSTITLGLFTIFKIIKNNIGI